MSLDNYLTLSGASDTGTNLSWTGFSNTTDMLTYTDVNMDGNSDIAQDSVSNGSTVSHNYSGYVVNVGGQDYGVFFNGSTFVVPYDSAIADLSTLFPSASSTGPRVDDVVLANCFMAGTMIGIPSGLRRIEDLQIGDDVTTADGRSVPVVWIARQTVRRPINLNVDERLAPVCITAGTLGNHSDLYVSADHGMVVDDLLINASALVNGDTVRFVALTDLPGTFTYYHIETEAHETILANGAASETFTDATPRTCFDNFEDYRDRYGTERVIPEMGKPRISAARMVPGAIKTRLGICRDTVGLDQRLTA